MEFTATKCAQGHSFYSFKRDLTNSWVRRDLFDFCWSWWASLFRVSIPVHVSCWGTASRPKCLHICFWMSQMHLFGCHEKQDAGLAGSSRFFWYSSMQGTWLGLFSFSNAVPSSTPWCLKHFQKSLNVSHCYCLTCRFWWWWFESKGEAT